MSVAGPVGPRGVLVAAAMAALRGHPSLGGMAVFDAPPVRGGLPYAVVEEPVLADASMVGWEGREGRLTVTLADAGERPVRLRGLLGAVEACLPAMPGVLGEGWRLAQMRLVRSRIVRSGARSGGGERWSGSAEFLVRLWRKQD